ncbi:homoserine O-acetyltransferase [Balneola sp. MJW-20]|uniref:homoserine O-acetyltransferase MetX n=1 Tax=Gracilimonas aurantiaca TaxID=3234185 RepID=UPI0034668258
MNDGISITELNRSWTTESGHVFKQVKIAWKSWGKLNKPKDNVVLICHALTGHAAADEWFSGLFNSGLFDLDKQFILCINVPGSCYGSTGPWDINPETGDPFRADFPDLSIRDLVTFQQLLLDEWEIRGIQTVIGSSMGGMTALEFALMDQRVRSAVLIAMGKAHSPWAIGISHAQRKALYADSKWNDGYYDPSDPPVSGLAAARAMAMITYRCPHNYEEKFGRNLQSPGGSFQVESYLDYQGLKLTERFDALTYHYLTRAMDSHDVSRNRGSFQEVLTQLKIPVLIVGIESDLLYPIHEQEELHKNIPDSEFKIMPSDFGHDAFLIEFETLGTYIQSFLEHHQEKIKS